MATIRNPDGSVTVTDDTGRLPPITVPASAAGMVPGSATAPSAAEPPPATLQGPAPAFALPPPATMAAGTAQVSQPFPSEVAPPPPAAPAPAPAVSTDVGAGGASGVSRGGSGGTTGAEYAGQPAVAQVPAPAVGERSGIPMSTDPAALAGGPSMSPNPAAEATTPWSGSKAEAGLNRALWLKPGGYTPPSPAMDILQGFRTQKGIKYSPEAKAGLAESYAHAADVAEESGDALRAKGLEVAAAHARAADVAFNEVAAIRDEQRQKQEQLINRMGVLDAHVARINNVADRDIVGKYASPSFGQRIAIALGALGSAITRTPNFAYEMFKEQRDAEIAQQKHRLESGHATANDMLNAYSQMRATYASPEAATEAAKTLLTHATQQQVLAAAAGAQGEEAASKYLDLAARLGVDGAQSRLKIEEMEADRIQQTWKHREAVKGGYSAPRMRTIDEAIKYGKSLGFSPEQVMRNLDGLSTFGAAKGTRGEVAAEKLRREGQVQFPDGTVMYATQGTIAKEAQEKIKANTGLIANLNEIEKLVKENTAAGSWPAGARHRLDVLVSRNRYYLKGAVIGEALTAAEKENFKALTGEEVLEYLTGTPNALQGLDQIRQGALKNIEEERRTLYFDASASPASAYGRQNPAGTSGAVEGPGVRRY